MTTYTLEYDWIATGNASVNDMGARAASVPRPPELETVFGLVFVSDTVTALAQGSRVLVYHDDSGTLVPSPGMADVLQGYMTGMLATALASPVTAQPVGTGP